jgi:hypothetical protein
MPEAAAPDIQSALSALAAVLRALRHPAMLIGGLAVIARGVPRFTIDIDAVIRAEGLDVDRLWGVLRNSGFEPRVENAAEFARQRQVLLLHHPASGMPVDLSLGWLAFEEDAIARATPVDFGGVCLPVATPADLVVLKAVAWRGIDRSDITELVVRHHSDMNFDLIRNTLAGFFEVLDEPERLREFDQLVADALAQS